MNICPSIIPRSIDLKIVTNKNNNVVQNNLRYVRLYRMPL